jgi:hypothetical protein
MGGKVTSAESEPIRGLPLGWSGNLGVAVDWLNLVGHGEAARASMLEVLQRWLGPGQARLGGLHSYREGWQFESGAILTWSPGRDDWLVSINGSTFGLVGQDQHLAFLLDVSRFMSHATRLDVRIDDYTRKLIDLDQIEAARQAVNFTGYKVCEFVPGRDRVKSGKLENQGHTINFGGRGKDGGGRFIRFYDKGLESKGLINSTRAEVEFSKRHAAEAFKQLVEMLRRDPEPVRVAVFLGGLVTGAIDFVERGNHRHIARMLRLSWWARLVAAAGQVKLKVERAASTLNRCLAALVQQYGRKLARAQVIAEGLGHDVYLQLWGTIDALRQGQELEDKPASPGELLFRPAVAFRSG